MEKIKEEEEKDMAADDVQEEDEKREEQVHERDGGGGIEPEEDRVCGSRAVLPATPDAGDSAGNKCNK